MTLPTPVSELTPDERRRELVATLAAGVLRVRRLRLRAGQPAPPAPKTGAELAAERLEVSGETGLSGLPG